jgi:hypothetical protein
MQTDLPRWLTLDVTILGQWDGRAETATDVARRWAHHLRQLDSVLSDSDPWVTTEGDQIEPNTDELEPFVDAGVERDAFGEAWPSAGFSVGLVRGSHGKTFHIYAHAGSSTGGRRVPSGSVMVTLHPEFVARVGQETVEAIFAATVAAWEPDTAALRDLEATKAGALTAWSPLVGQRSWISARTGSIGQLVPGVSGSPREGGTLVIADDGLTSAEAAAAVRAVFDTNGIESIPRAT